MIGERLPEIQGWLERTYDLAPGPPVSEYLVERRDAVGLAPLVATREETLLVAEGDGEIGLGLVLAERVLVARESDLGALCAAIEGVSHFVYVAFKGAHDVAVTRLELEVQAEVDKYVACASGDHGGAHDERWFARLFEGASFVDPPGSSERERYELATREAARLCRVFEDERTRAGTVVPLLPELRRFYRLGQQGKLEHIRRRAA